MANLTWWVMLRPRKLPKWPGPFHPFQVGVGPVTVAMLPRNVVESAEQAEEV